MSDGKQSLFEDSRLLPVNGDAQDESHFRNATLFGAYANLITGIVGVGVLSFPYAFLQTGVYLNMIFTIAFGLLNVYTITLMSRTFTERLIRTNQLKHATYEGVVMHYLGTPAYYIITGCILLTVIGVLTAFFIVAADLGQPVLEEWITVDGFIGDFLTSRVVVVLFFAIFFAFPLSLFGNMHHLSFTSIISAGSAFFVAVVVIFRGCQALAEDPRKYTDDISLVQDNFRIILALPLCVFALGCSLQIVPMYAELNKERRNDFMPVVVLAMFSCAILYIVVGCFGYIQFGDDTKGDILTNYDVSDIPVDIAKLVMGIHLVLAYPVALFPGRKCLDFLVLRVLPVSRIPARLRLLAEGVGMIALTSLFAVFVPQVQIVFGLIGATVGVALGMFFPATLLWVVPDNEEDFVETPISLWGPHKNSKQTKVKAALLFLFGVVVMIGGTGVSIYQEFIE